MRVKRVDKVILLCGEASNSSIHVFTHASPRHFFSLLCTMCWMVPGHAQDAAPALEKLTVRAHPDTKWSV